MFKRGALPFSFHPNSVKDFVVFGTHFTVKMQYMGPIPSMSKLQEPEVFWFAFYRRDEMLDELIESGTLDWDSENGPLTYDGVATAVLLFCHKPADFSHLQSIRNNS